MFTITTGDMFQQKKSCLRWWQVTFIKHENTRSWPWPSNHLHHPFGANFLTVLSSSWLSFLAYIPSFSAEWPCVARNVSKNLSNCYTEHPFVLSAARAINFPDLWLSFTQHTSSNLQIPAVVKFLRLAFAEYPIDINTVVLIGNKIIMVVPVHIAQYAKQVIPISLILILKSFWLDDPWVSVSRPSHAMTNIMDQLCKCAQKPPHELYYILCSPCLSLQ